MFSCHKCARWSNPILTFLTFHEIDFATNVPSVLFNRAIFGSCLYLLMPFYYRYNCIHIVQRVELGVCFSIYCSYGLSSNEYMLYGQFFIYFLAFDFCQFCVVIRFFIPTITTNDLRLRRIFYHRFYPLHLFSYFNS